jgi:transcriptional regulator with XRE-family HTH domain
MTKQFKKRLGSTVRKVRRDRGLTQAELAEFVHISTEALSRIERGITAPAAKTLLDLMSVLDLERRDLVQPNRREKTLPYSKEVTAVAEKLSRAPKERAAVARKIVDLVLKVE